jgi:hypothetical protein
MELRILGIAASAALLTGWSGPAAAPQQSVTYTAHMNGTAATPPNTEKATGTATLTLMGNQLRYTITAQGLSGPATAAHIHVGEVGAGDHAGVARQPPGVRREGGLEAVESGADSIPVASVNVTPTTASLAVGATQQLTASTLDASGNALTGRVVIWSTSDATKASVSSTGLVTAVAAGTATITATSEGKTGTSVIN